jgi:hypothetical protein
LILLPGLFIIAAFNPLDTMECPWAACLVQTLPW